jgi:REP element-mobilizing transposase RayT
MPRQARLDYAGALQHVIARGVARTRIFDDKKDRETFLGWFGGLLKESGAQCLAWALLSNHFHLLLRTTDWPLKVLMQRLLTRYSVYYNHRHGRSGHLFQNRYKSIVCEEEAYLLELVRYIHLNPLRAGEVESYAELGRYPWCGHCAVIGVRKVEWQETGDVLGEFGSKRNEALESYGEFVREGIRKGRRPELVGGGLIRSLGGIGEAVKTAAKREKMQSDERILGSGEYVAEVIREVEHRDRRKGGMRKRLDPREVIRRACKVMGAEESQLYGHRKVKEVSKARSLACKWLVEDLGMRISDVARMLKVTHPAVVYGARKGREVEATTRAKISI